MSHLNALFIFIFEAQNQPRQKLILYRAKMSVSILVRQNKGFYEKSRRIGIRTRYSTKLECIKDLHRLDILVSVDNYLQSAPK